MKFLHIADPHLDSPLQGVSKRAGIPEHIVRDCTRRAFANAIDLAIAQDVDFVLIAGDLYDADWKDFSTALFFANEMRRLARPCLVVRGNHDAHSVITSHLEPPPNVKIFSSRTTESFTDIDGVAIHGRSFPNRAVPEDLSATYPAPIAGRLNIGLLHTSAENRGEHETYAPCTVQSLAGRGYQYWALGHIHTRAVLHETPFIVFPGNTQGRHVREPGAKGVTLVSAANGQVTGVAHHPTDVLRWGIERIDLAGAETMAEATTRLRFALTGALAAAEGRPLILRLALTGRTALHDRLRADPVALLAECQAAAAALSGELFIEGVRAETSAPTDPDAADALRHAFMEALDDPEATARLLADFKSLAAAIPRLAGRDPLRLPETAEDLRALAPEAWLAVAHLLGQGA